jgi:putative endonuclease
MEKYFVYVLRSKIKNITYVGCTNDLHRRFVEHNSGKSRFTRKYKPWEIIYSEEVSSQLEALQKEKYFKSSAGRKKLKTLLS